jgi:cytochrome b561
MGLHIINGIIMFIFTLSMVLEAIKYFDGEILWTYTTHTAMGFIFFLITSTIVFFGFLAWGVVTYPESYFWNGVQTLKLNEIHKLIGYILLISS